jgi:hypothetical protein
MHRLPRRLAAAGAAAAAIAAVLAPSASAHDRTFAIGFVTESVEADQRTVTGALQCVGDDLAGRVVTLRAESDVDIERLTAGDTVGLEVRRDDKRVVEVLDGPPCEIGTAEETVATPEPPRTDDDDRVRDDHDDDRSGEHKVKVKAETEDGSGEDEERPRKVYPAFARSFLSRVWRFGGEADGFSDGVLSMTIGRVYNLPRKWRRAVRGLVDSDARVLVAPSVKVFDGRKPVPERREAEILADADRVRIQGKLLPAAKWLEDEDGEPVPTIRAKRVYVTR